MDDYIYGLTFGCPHLVRAENCPLKHVEELTIKEKYSWINNLSSDEKQKILDHHLLCTHNRID
jgi:hypothetical protein